MNSIGWLGGGVAPVAIAAASGRYGMSACLSANSTLYLAFGLLLIYGVSKSRLRQNIAIARAS